MGCQGSNLDQPYAKQVHYPLPITSAQYVKHFNDVSHVIFVTPECKSDVGFYFWFVVRIHLVVVRAHSSFCP